MRFSALAALLLFSVLASVAFAFGAARCAAGPRTLSAEDRAKLQEYILDSAPADIPHTLDVDFDGKVHLIGYDFRPEAARPGQQVRLTFWWRCDAPVGDGWMLFTHVQDPGGAVTSLDFKGPLREQRDYHQLLGPDRWEKGKVYVDSQAYTIPADFAGAELTVYVGIWKGHDRMSIRGAGAAGDNRALVGKIQTR
ncbi:MAG TPA: hypothetical protein VE987_03215 [Polyangiaceae bacterium]|nr:hypothetical protein [Polyangiaceae bacterium]